jgi:ribonuclease III
VGEKRSNGHSRPSILADSLEAIIAAVHLDGGYDQAKNLVHRLFTGYEIAPTMPAIEKDPKTELQEWLQGRKYGLPTYGIAGITGQAHKQTFDIQCEIPKLGLSERGTGNSRRAAEQLAAEAVLVTIKNKGLE